MMGQAELAVVRFRIGGVTFALDAAQVSRILDSNMESSSRQEAGRWRSMAEVKVSGLADIDDGVARILLLKPGGYMRVCEPVELAQLPLHSLHPLPVLVAARMQIDGIKALCLSGDCLILLLVI
jgi:hypothetical protein